MDAVQKLTREQAMSVGVNLGAEQLSKFSRYYELLLSENRKYNLTGICTRDEIVTKHFIDSILCSKLGLIRGKERIIDVGSGAGFPGIPLKILYPKIGLILLEATQKKAQFLRKVIVALGLDDVAVANERAEIIGQGKGYRESFGIAVSRAVAALPVLLEYCLPLLSPGGYFFAFKGPGVEEEMRASAGVAEILGGEVSGIHDFVLPGGQGDRKIVVYRKTGPSDPKYPRRPGIPVKRPLK